MDVGGLTATLLSLHGMVATFAKAPELELTESEAKTLALGIRGVEAHYPVPGLSDGHKAILALGVTAFAVYRPRVVAILARKHQAVQAQADQPPMTGGMPMAPPPSATTPAPWVDFAAGTVN